MSLSTTQYGYIVDPMVPFTDDKGKTIKNGFIRVFIAGTSTPVLTYCNYDGATNQEKIELDNSGRVKHNVIGSKGSLYKVVVYNILHSQENPLLTVDKIAVLGASINASGATIVTGLDSVTVQEENFLKATVEGTGVELALDPTEVTSEVSTTADAVTAAPDYVVPLLDKTGTGDGKKISLANLFKFALDWISRLATTVTSFASGDFIAVSNTTNGARKMSKDTLLELTAQNALFKGFSADLPNDLNDCSLNTIYNCTDAVVGASISNKPEAVNNFSVLTFGSANNTLVQFFVPANEQVLYYRSRWRANWTGWMTVDPQILANRFSSSLSYSKGARIFRNGYPYVAKEAVSAGSWDSSEWKDIFNKLALVITGSSSELPSDLNNCIVNTLYSCTDAVVGASISNKPKAVNNFSVFTFGETNTTMFQIFAPAMEKNFYFRSKWGANWTGWTLLPQVLNNILLVFSSSSAYTKGQRVFNGGSPYMAKQAVSAGSWDSSKWVSVLGKTCPVVVGGTSDLPSDLNDCLINTIYTCTNATTGASISHKPVAASQNQFFVVTYGQESGAVQFYFEPFVADLYVRERWGATWGSWKNIFGWESLQKEYFDINVLSAFNNIVCIGDSLTYSQVYTSDNTSRQAYRTYPQILGKLCGSDSVESFAIGGITASQSWANYNASVTSKTNALAIVYLGTNGGLTDTLATDADPNADPSTWADTNTGCYAKWVNKLQTLGYKVLLIKIYAGGGGDIDTTNDVIGQIATRFNCAVVDAFYESSMKYHYYPDLSGRNTLHYNDLGYAWFASALIEKVQKLPNDVLKYIIPS